MQKQINQAAVMLQFDFLLLHSYKLELLPPNVESCATADARRQPRQWRLAAYFVARQM